MSLGKRTESVSKPAESLSTPLRAQQSWALEVALELARRIADDAVWHRNRCNWMGAEPITLDGRGRPLSPGWSNLGIDLYSGTAGVAYFLARAATLGEDRALAKAARGAIAHAFHHLPEVPADQRLGLYSGWSGVAWAGWQVGQALGDERVMDSSLRLAARLPARGGQSINFDLIAGRAGAVLALTRLAEQAGRLDLLERAATVADALAAQARRSADGLSWSAPDATAKSANLTGFSHGTAGAAYALTAVGIATGSDRWAAVAAAALDYEAGLFSAREGNWPDLRSGPGVGRRLLRPKYATYWCHGAPGIALSRLGIVLRTGTGGLERDANIAMATTRRAVRRAVESGSENYSLCHGLAGNADVLLEASRASQTDNAENAELAMAVAREGARLHAADATWPCGTQTGPTPALMLGTAGIGLFYLRLAEASTPSVLLI